MQLCDLLEDFEPSNKVVSRLENKIAELKAEYKAIMKQAGSAFQVA